MQRDTIVAKPLWQQLCFFDNLVLANRQARKRKTRKPYVREFERNLTENLQQLRTELLLHAYRPKPLQSFVIHEPKTRKISKSDYRDRVVHHAIVNVIESIFERLFLDCSFANRIEKGGLNAVVEFERIAWKVSRNWTRSCYVLKADIYHYFPQIDHGILLRLLSQRIADQQVLWLIRRILANYHSPMPGRGMPLGNLTSQFFANVYLHELDRFVKHTLKAKYYVRYVDDFVILHHHKAVLEDWRKNISSFLSQHLALTLHPHKQCIQEVRQGINFLGFRIFPRHWLLRKTNIRTAKGKLEQMITDCQNDGDYDTLFAFLDGWMAYARNADTIKLRKRMVALLEKHHSGRISSIEIDRWLKCLKDKR